MIGTDEEILQTIVDEDKISEGYDGTPDTIIKTEEEGSIGIFYCKLNFDMAILPDFLGASIYIGSPENMIGQQQDAKYTRIRGINKVNEYKNGRERYKFDDHMKAMFCSTDFQ